MSRSRRLTRPKLEQRLNQATFEAIINAATRFELDHPKLVMQTGSRATRIARGSGQRVLDVRLAFKALTGSRAKFGPISSRDFYEPKIESLAFGYAEQLDIEDKVEFLTEVNRKIRALMETPDAPDVLKLPEPSTIADLVDLALDEEGTDEERSLRVYDVLEEGERERLGVTVLHLHYGPKFRTQGGDEITHEDSLKVYRDMDADLQRVLAIQGIDACLTARRNELSGGDGDEG